MIQQTKVWMLAVGVSAAIVAPAVAAQAQILVSVGAKAVTARDLHEAMASSPFYTQFNAMDANEQGAMRGDLLKRLVASRLLLEEAESLKLDQAPLFRKDLETYRKGLLYRRYMRQLRNSIAMPDDVKAAISQDLRGNADAQAAAKSRFISANYKRIAREKVSALRKKYHVKTFVDRIRPDISADTVLMQGDDGLIVRYGDIVDMSKYASLPDKLAVESELYKRAELEVIVKAALDAGMDVSAEIASYRKERLPAFLMDTKIKQWTPDEAELRAYYEQHPESSKVPDQWLVGQVVLKSRKQAEAVKKRIDKGESLFKLAGELSIDPYGKSHNGDMGWVIQGKGIPQIENAIENLDNGEISDIIETPAGFHIVMMRDRKQGEKLSFTTVKTRIIQNIVSAKRADYLKSLQKKHKVVWKVMEKKKPAPAVESNGKDS